MLHVRWLMLMMINGRLNIDMGTRFSFPSSPPLCILLTTTAVHHRSVVVGLLSRGDCDEEKEGTMIVVQVSFSSYVQVICSAEANTTISIGMRTKMGQNLTEEEAVEQELQKTLLLIISLKSR